MKSVKLLLILMLSTAFIGLTKAQGTIKGVVKDASSHESLVGATVIVAGTTNGVTTSFDGSFFIKSACRKTNFKNQLRRLSVHD